MTAVPLSAPAPTTTNGEGTTHASSAATSPAPLDSPTTPVSNLETDSVKIAQPSDDPPHHLSLPPLPDPLKLEAASHVPEVGTPVDPDSIPIHPPHGTPPPPTGELLPEVQMAESSSSTTELGSALPDAGQHDDDDVSMKTETAGSPPPPVVTTTNGHARVDAPMPSDASMASFTDDVAFSPSPTGMRRSADAMLEDEPPAKRARRMSDDEHEEPSTDFTATSISGRHGPAPTPTPTPSIFGDSTTTPLTPAQWRFCASTVRSLKKLKDAAPFLRPVDPVALNIPHYPQIIQHPMDFSTIDRKLAASNPAKPDPNQANPRYTNTEQFIVDVRRIFANCMTFNGPEHLVTQMGQRVEAVFDKQLKQLPSADEPLRTEVSPPAPRKSGGPPVRRPSASVPAIRRDENNARPKREIHAPPPRDISYPDLAKRAVRKPRVVKDETTVEQLRFCAKVLSELHKKQYYNFASPFYEPVDWVKLEIPTYPKVIKKPMDLSTMRRKLDTHEYSSAQKFHDDFRLMIRNCFQFNPQGTPVNQAGMELQRLFDDKWRGLPHAGESDSDEEEEEEEHEDDRLRAIADMENQMETMRQNLTALKSGVAPKEKKKKKKAPKPAPAPVASSSKPKASKPPPHAPAAKSIKKGKAKVAEEDALTFDQKKALSDAIGALDGGKLERVIQIIHEGVPEIRDSTEEIELEIDSLPASVLTKLYNFVLKPARVPGQPKRNRTSKGGGTGGLKRKSMDEDVEAEKIRQLEERMRLFEDGQGGSAAPAPAVVASDSDSSGSSDESDSDSD